MLSAMFIALGNITQRNNLAMFDVYFTYKIMLMQNAFTYNASLVIYADTHKQKRKKFALNALHLRNTLCTMC